VLVLNSGEEANRRDGRVSEHSEGKRPVVAGTAEEVVGVIIGRKAKGA